jgi:chromosome partitioning protein
VDSHPPKSARIIAVLNQKGGTAKTTTSVCLGTALADLGQRVLLIDLDPQGSATEWFGHSPAGMGLAEVLTAGRTLESATVPTGIGGLELVPASKALAAADKDLAQEWGIHTALQQAVSGLEQRDLVLIDCPGNLGLLSVMALAAAGEVLVPVTAGAMELGGMAELIRTVEKVRDRLNPQVRITAVLVCRVDQYGAHTSRIASDTLDTLRCHFPDQVLSTVIHETVRLREAPSHQLPIGHYDPGGVGDRDYRAAAHELISPREVAHVR